MTVAPPARREVRSFLELTGATGLAVAQPVLDAFRDGAEVFVLRRSSAADVVGFALVVAFGPPLALWAVEHLIGRVAGPRVRDGVHLGILGFVVAAGVAILARDASPVARAVLVVVAAVAVVGLVRRGEVVKRALRYVAVLPAVVVAVFLFTDPVAEIVLAADGDADAAAAIARPAPIVMVVLDELPLTSLLDDAGTIDARQFPNLARLADDATLYRNHTSVAPSTPQAVPAILTGRYPDSGDRLPISAAYPENLFSLLGPDYRHNVFESSTRLCPESLCGSSPGLADGHGLGGLVRDGIDVWRDQVAGTDVDEPDNFAIRQTDPSAPTTFRSFIDTLDADPGRRLDFLHVLYPHQPWFRLPTGERYAAPFIADGLTGDYHWQSAGAADEGRKRHLLQLQHADLLVGELLNRLGELGTYDESLIVVTADHGVAFTAGAPIRGVAADNYDEVMWTPLLVKAPDQTDGSIDDRPMSAVDVLPTMADHLGAEIPWAVDGTSALAPAPADGDRRVFEWSLNELPPDDGPYVTVDGSAGFQSLLSREPPGQGSDPNLRFYRFGPYGHLVGRPVDELSVGEPVDLEVTIEGAADLADLDITSSELPVYISGRGDPARADPVAVAVNGVIGGWSDWYSDDGELTFWTLVPRALLADGANEVEVFVLSGSASNPVLSATSTGA